MMASPADIAKADPVAMLAQNYNNDLVQLSKMVPSVITDKEIRILQSMSLKYKISGKVNEDNFYDIKGRLAAIIQDKLHQLAVVDVLERVREDTPSKRRKGINIEREQVPEVVE